MSFYTVGAMLITMHVFVLALCISLIVPLEERNISLPNISTVNVTEDESGQIGITEDWNMSDSTSMEPLNSVRDEYLSCNTSFRDSENISLCVDPSIDDTGKGEDSSRKQGPISEELSKEIIVKLQYFVAVLCLLSLVTNALNIAVFLSQTQNSTNCYLIAISFIDMLSGAAIFAAALSALIIREEAFANLFYLTYNTLCVVLYLSPVLQRILYFLVFHVSLERLLVVAFPLKAKGFIFMRYPKTIITTSCLIVAVFHIFSPLRIFIKSTVVQPGNSTIHYLAPTDLYMENIEEFAATSTASKVIFVYILLVGALITNLVVVCVLKRHSQKRRQMKMSSDKEKAARTERKTTITIVTSSLVFLILSLPLNTASIFANIRVDLVGLGKPYAPLFSVIAELCNTLVIVSLSTDFIAYMTLSTRFRSTCLRILHIRKPGEAVRQTDLGMTDHTQVSEVNTKY